MRQLVGLEQPFWEGLVVVQLEVALCFQNHQTQVEEEGKEHPNLRCHQLLEDLVGLVLLLVLSDLEMDYQPRGWWASLEIFLQLHRLVLILDFLVAPPMNLQTGLSQNWLMLKNFGS